MSKPNKADNLIYKAFSKALEQNLLHIYLDTGKINRPTSPIYNPWENLLPILIPTLIGLLLIITVSTLFGLAFIIGILLTYNYYFKRLIDKRLVERTKAYITTDFEHCQQLWEYGGIVLAAETNRKLGCISPEGDWKEFIVKNFADFMTDKSEVKTEENDKQTAAAK